MYRINTKDIKVTKLAYSDGIDMRFEYEGHTAAYTFRDSSFVDFDDIYYSPDAEDIYSHGVCEGVRINSSDYVDWAAARESNGKEGSLRAYADEQLACIGAKLGKWHDSDSCYDLVSL